MPRTERLILIVDDSPEDRESVRRFLRKDAQFEYRFLENSTGLEGLQTCRTSSVDCVLLDYDLPDLNGLRFLEELTEGTDRAPVPVVMLTGRGGEAIAVEALKRGAQDYLVKGSYSPESLRKSVDDAIDRVAIRRQFDHQRQELERLYGELRESDRRKDEFLAILAHELRNPLAPILNAIHVMKTGNLEKPVFQRMCGMVDQQVHHLCRLVDDLLDVSRINTGKIQLRLRKVDLAEVATLAVAHLAPSIEERRQVMTLNLPGVPIWVEADPTRLEQVLANLLGNASKYTDPGGSIILAIDRDDDQAVIRVKDNGIGIDPEMIPRVFDLFAQADHSLARSQGGLGIGLTLVRNLIQLHGGSIEARSDGLGQGSEFIVRLRLAKDDPLPEEKVTESETSALERPLKILIVDDNVHAAESLAMVIKLWNHDALVANEGRRAIDAALAYKPEVVLLDIGLPDMDGYRVADNLRLRPELHGVTMIAMTGYGRDEDIQRSRSVGFRRHLVKPIDFGELQSILDSVASERSA